MFRSNSKAIVRSALALGVLGATVGAYTMPAPVHASGCSTLTATYNGKDPYSYYYFNANYPAAAGVQYNSYYYNTTNGTLYSGNPASWTSDGHYTNTQINKQLVTSGVKWQAYFTDQNANGCQSNAITFTTS